MTAYAVAVMTGSPARPARRTPSPASASACSTADLANFRKSTTSPSASSLMLFGSGWLFFRQAFIKPKAPDLPAIPFGACRTSAGAGGARRQRAVLIGAALAGVLWWPSATPARLIAARRRRQFRRRARHGPHPDTCACWPPASAGLAGIGGAYLSLYYPGSWTEAHLVGPG